MIRQRLKTKLSLAIALVVLLTVVLISYFSNVLINKQFATYKLTQLESRTQGIVNSLSLQYSQSAKTWDADFVHSIGMLAMQDGFLLKVSDTGGNIVWDAESHDMKTCNSIMADMTRQMKMRNPAMKGGFIAKTFDIQIDQEVIGSVTIRYFSPYFLSENDFMFIRGLNMVLIIVGLVSLLLSILVGFFLARRLSDPIRQTVEATKQINAGNYDTRIHEKTGTVEVNELMDSINHLAETLGKQEILRKQLTADVAHEFRTPLTTLQTHLEAMLEGVWEPTPARLQSCHDEITRISRMVVDLENLARVENDNLNLNLNQVNLKDIVQKTVSGYETAIKEKNLHVSVEGECPDIEADPDRIYQAVSNLFSNAVKYTPQDGIITMTCSATDKSVRLSVKDTGIGISENDLPYIFERFFRADKSRNKMTGGSGIGLAIVQSIITAHGGTVSVVSRLGEGSEFIIELPL